LLWKEYIVLPDLLENMRRTHNCGELSIKDVDKEVILMGWVLRRRDHGGVIFVDLRDREGITQVVFNPTVDKAVHAKAHAIRNEYVLGVKGKIDPRPESIPDPRE
jgi:aspartyl-tRNA synthetase